jgi:hypothetical protein
VVLGKAGHLFDARYPKPVDKSQSTCTCSQAMGDCRCVYMIHRRKIHPARLANIAEAIYEPEFDMITDAALWNAVLLLLESFASNLTKTVPSRKDKRAENRALRSEREPYPYRYRQDMWPIVRQRPSRPQFHIV